MPYTRTTWQDFPDTTTPIDAARLNNIEAMLASIADAGDAWTAYTPTYTNVTLGTGPSQSSAYTQIGKTVFVRTQLTLGTGASLSGSVTISLPVTARSGVWQAGMVWGVAYFRDASPFAQYSGTLNYDTTTTVTVNCLRADATYLTMATLSGTVPFTWTDSDRIYTFFAYEAA
jgi:hypothetical protein